jgi:hypothetical protein
MEIINAREGSYRRANEISTIKGVCSRMHVVCSCVTHDVQRSKTSLFWEGGLIVAIMRIRGLEII